MLNHLDLYKIITALQHGFWNWFSCETQLIVTLHDLMKYKDNKIQTDIVILDVWKDFNTVHNVNQLNMLKHYGITVNILDCIPKIKGTESSSGWHKCRLGTCRLRYAMENCLWPLLFLLHFNDLPKYINKQSTVRLFVDDCKMFRKIKTIKAENDFQKS